MSDPIHPPRRKRSVAAGLSAVGAAAMLSGCDPTPSVEQLSRERHGEPTEVSAFQSVSECTASGAFSRKRSTPATGTPSAYRRDTSKLAKSPRRLTRIITSSGCSRAPSPWSAAATPA